jgi:type II secretory pathway predicted ATPase ExeA
MSKLCFPVPPFTRELKIEQRFKVDFLEAESEALRRVVSERQSAVLVAPAGAGKSVVLRATKAGLPEARHAVYYIKLADLSARDMCRQVALALGLEPAGHFPSLARALEQRLRSGYEEHGMRQVIVFDDAHDLRPEVLRLVRLLTNCEMDSRLVVSVILAGQLPLKKRLLEPDLEDVRQRLVHCGELRLLSGEETREYLEHRVRIAGATVSPFGKGAHEALFEVTRGNMRALDKMAGAAVAHAVAHKRDAVDPSDVAAVRSRQWM